MTVSGEMSVTFYDTNTADMR